MYFKGWQKVVCNFHSWHLFFSCFSCAGINATHFAPPFHFSLWAFQGIFSRSTSQKARQNKINFWNSSLPPGYLSCRQLPPHVLVQDSAANRSCRATPDWCDYFVWKAKENHCSSSSNPFLNGTNIFSLPMMAYKPVSYIVSVKVCSPSQQLSSGALAL